MTFVHFLIQLLGCVILSRAKNLSERPFVALRVTTLVCQSPVVRFSAPPHQRHVAVCNEPERTRRGGPQ